MQGYKSSSKLCELLIIDWGPFQIDEALLDWTADTKRCRVRILDQYQSICLYGSNGKARQGVQLNIVLVQHRDRTKAEKF